MSCGRRPCGEGDPGRGVLDRDEMVKYLEQEVKDGDCILFKGSNSMGLSVVADKFAELEEK